MSVALVRGHWRVQVYDKSTQRTVTRGAKNFKDAVELDKQLMSKLGTKQYKGLRSYNFAKITQEGIQDYEY